MSDTVIPAVAAGPVPPSLAEAPYVPKPETLAPAQGINIFLTETSAVIKNLAGVRKTLTHSELASVLNKYLKDEEVRATEKPILPPPGLIYLATSAKGMTVVTYHPEGKRNITYGSTSRISVVPNILVMIQLDREAGNKLFVKDSRYYCTRKPLTEIDRKVPSGSSAHLKFLPFTNMYNDHRMCFGNNTMPRNIPEGDLRELGWYYEVLWNSPFNNDLGIYALDGNSKWGRNGAHGSQYMALWYEHLAKLAEDNQPFPYSEINL